jgi:hypothetical protein
MSSIELLEKNMPPFATLMGVKILSASQERVTAEMLVRDDLCTVPAVLHVSSKRFNAKFN